MKKQEVLFNARENTRKCSRPGWMGLGATWDSGKWNWTGFKVLSNPTFSGMFELQPLCIGNSHLQPKNFPFQLLQPKDDSPLIPPQFLRLQELPSQKKRLEVLSASPLFSKGFLSLSSLPGFGSLKEGGRNFSANKVLYLFPNIYIFPWNLFPSCGVPDPAGV